jgi:hypothetical protein
MGYLGTKPSNSPLTSELIPNSIITNAKINDVAATKLTGTLPDANAPSGSVLQVVSSVITTQFSSGSSSFVTTGLTASITPISSSSKILIITSHSSTQAASNQPVNTTIYRNSTNLGGTFGFIVTYGSSAGTMYNGSNMTYLDSPSTTSSTTYTVYARSETGSTFYFGNSGSPSSIILMEIAA